MPELKKIATRESYGQALVELGERYDDLIVLDADLAAATKTGLFKKAFPERHIDCGIAEANMMGVAAGLSLTGKVPFASTFAMFAAGRAYEQVRNTIGYPHLNVKIGATHAGISVGEDGASHQCLEDLALMRMIPGMTVMCPADDIEARAMVEAAYHFDGPVYMRFGRLAVEEVNDAATYRLEWGKGRVLQPRADVALLATGPMVAPALVAAQRLKKALHMEARIPHLTTLHPLDEALGLPPAGHPELCRTADDLAELGWLGGAIAELLTEKAPKRLLRIGVRDTFGESGPATELLQKYKLDEAGVYEAVREALKNEGVF